ncbi:MAG: hypothetical protein RSF67_10090, partial [Clostridia bacterium]
FLLLPYQLLLLSIFLLLCISLIIYVIFTNNISYSKVSDVAYTSTKDMQVNSSPVIINNLVLGGVYNNNFVSNEGYYTNSVNKKDYEINMFSSDSKLGKYNIKEVNMFKNTMYAITTKTSETIEYVAANVDKNSGIKKVTEYDNDLFINKCRSSLGIYGILNFNIKINEVYEFYFNNGISNIICFSGRSGNTAYYAMTFIDSSGKQKLIKYNYVANIKDSSLFNVYTLKFVIDLNNDNVNEIIIQETSEFKTKYVVLEYNKNKFYEILSSEIENNI